ncbi:MAG: HrgA protein [Pseudomonadota bacterium]
MAFNLSDKVAEFLEENIEQKFTARQIAEWIYKSYPEECEEKKKRSNATVIPINNTNALIQQLVAEIGSHRPQMEKKFLQLRTTESRPRKYYFTEKTDEAEIKTAEFVVEIKNSPEPQKTGEHALYPMLAEFLQSEFNIYSKRINEKRSSNNRGSGGNKWLYPDVVGMENLSEDWNREIKDCVKQYADKKTKLWSFEVKILVNRSNIREVFFQTVSNSSWANFAYLVASEIEGSDTIKEMRILSGLHGIGFILLNTENPAESEIIIPARERIEIDWGTTNRLAEENKDFLEYIKLIRQFYQTGDVPASGWDTIQQFES